MDSTRIELAQISAFIIFNTTAELFHVKAPFSRVSFISPVDDTEAVNTSGSVLRSQGTEGDFCIAIYKAKEDPSTLSIC